LVTTTNALARDVKLHFLLHLFNALAFTAGAVQFPPLPLSYDGAKIQIKVEPKKVTQFTVVENHF